MGIRVYSSLEGWSVDVPIAVVNEGQAAVDAYIAQERAAPPAAPTAPAPAAPASSPAPSPSPLANPEE